MLLLVILGIAFLIFIYQKAVLPHQHWKKKGVPHPKPVFLLGYTAPNLFAKKDFSSLFIEIYNKFSNERYFGVYQFLLPVLTIRDPELIKLIAVKDFDNFQDHRLMVPDEVDPLWNKNLFTIRGQKWRDMRPILSPAFTSSKMKYMFLLIEESAQQFITYFMKKDVDIVELELKDAFTKFTNDVIASTAFGLKCDSLNYPKNQFYLMGKKITDFTGVKMLRFFLCALSIWLVKVLNIKVIGNDVSAFFRKIIKDTITMRTEEGLIRQDMIHLLLEARKGRKNCAENGASETKYAVVDESSNGFSGKVKKAPITDDDITAHALIFFFAGFDTSSSLMCFISYELALSSDIQERLRQEVDDTFHNCGGKLTYDALMNMRYLDMVVSETLRKWPPTAITDRVAVKPYTIPSVRPQEKPLYLEKGSIIWFPIICIHRDPKYYPNPNKFDPERFSDENKHNIQPYAFIPFGTGPRSCIGARFGILETKIIIYHILRNFEIVSTKKTSIPMKFSPKHFNFTPADGFWMGLKRRKQNIH